MSLHKAMLIAVVIMAPLESAMAEPHPPVYVSGEAEVAKLRGCGITYATAIAAVEGALRYNRVKVASREDWLSDKALNGYVNINAFEITRGASDVGTGLCVVAVNFSINTAFTIRNPVTETDRFATIQFCENGFLGTMRPLEAQERVNTRLRQYVDECVSKYESK